MYFTIQCERPVGGSLAVVSLKMGHVMKCPKSFTFGSDNKVSFKTVEPR